MKIHGMKCISKKYKKNIEYVQFFAEKSIGNYYIYISTFER